MVCTGVTGLTLSVGGACQRGGWGHSSEGSDGQDYTRQTREQWIRL